MPAEVVKEYIFRLHRSGPPWPKQWDEIDWDAIEVGEPVRFAARLFGNDLSGWQPIGPVEVKAPEVLDDAAWTVSVGRGEAPAKAGYVGRPLAAGEEFALPGSDQITVGVSH
jgi:hypothetical protein